MSFVFYFLPLLPPSFRPSFFCFNASASPTEMVSSPPNPHPHRPEPQHTPQRAGRLEKFPNSPVLVPVPVYKSLYWMDSLLEGIISSQGFVWDCQKARPDFKDEDLCCNLCPDDRPIGSGVPTT